MSRQLLSLSAPELPSQLSTVRQAMTTGSARAYLRVPREGSEGSRQATGGHARLPFKWGRVRLAGNETRKCGCTEQTRCRLISMRTEARRPEPDPLCAWMFPLHAQMLSGCFRRAPSLALTWAILFSCLPSRWELLTG